MSDDMIRKGIAAYAKEQAVILRLLRKRGKFTELEFDAWLLGREFKRPKFYARAVTGDAFILGMGQNGGSQWAEWLDLMQHMMRIGLITAKTENGLVVYRLP